jgi:NADH:ubiquinone oxidoreductase subunit D
VKSLAQVKVPKGEAYARVEGPRGEVGCFLVSDGTNKPYRMKWRGASFSNLAVLPHILPGCSVADVVAIMGSSIRCSARSIDERRSLPPAVQALIMGAPCSARSSGFSPT